MSASPNKLQTWRYKGPGVSTNLSIDVHTPKKPQTNYNQFDSNTTPTRIGRTNEYEKSPNNASGNRERSSPFNAGRRNESFRSPTYESNLFNNLNYPEKLGRQNQSNYASISEAPDLRRSLNLTPKIGQPENKQGNNNYAFKSGPKSISSTSSGTKAEDLVCNNCVNRELMEEQMLRKLKEDEHDKILRQIQDSNYRKMMLEEQKRVQENKDRYKQEVNDLQLQKQLQKQMERDEAVKNGPMSRNNEDWVQEQQFRDAAANTKNDLRRTLLEQMKEREVSKLYDRFQDNGKAGLSLREEEDQNIRHWMANKQKAGQELKSQILLNEERKKMEKEMEREKNEQARRDRMNAEKQAQEQLLSEDMRKKNSLKNGILNQMQERKLNEEAEKLNKFKYAQVQKDHQDQMEKMYMSQLANKKNAEKELEYTLKNQMAAKQMQSELEKERERAFRTEMCPHKCKLYTCSICNRKYPRSYLSKRSVSPFR